MRRTCRTEEGRQRARIGPLALALIVLSLTLAVPGVQAHSGHGDDPLGSPSVGPSDCPDSDMGDPSASAFEQVDGTSPPAPLQTDVSCRGSYIVKASTAKELKVGGTYVAFFTVHNADTGEPIAFDGTSVQETGAAAGDLGEITFLSARVDGTPGLRAVTLQAAAPGQAELTVKLPTGESVGTVTFDVQGSGTNTDNGQTDTPGGVVPGFEAGILVLAVVAAALILGKRRPPAALATLMVVALLVPGAAAHGGAHGGGSGQFTPQVRVLSDGFQAQTQGLDAQLTATVNDDVQLYDLGDFTTAEGPRYTHTYDRSGIYLVQLVSYDTSDLTGAVYTREVQVGDEPGNDPPVSVVRASVRWTTFDSTVTFDASDTTEINNDDLRYVWTVGRAAVDGANFTFAVTQVTEDPVLNWSAPSKKGDYQITVLALDARRGFSESSTEVRVTAELPPKTEEFGPFNGTITAPREAAEAGAADSNDTTARHEVTFAYGGDAVFNLTFSGSGGVDEANLANSAGVPDIDMEVWAKGHRQSSDEALAPGSPKVLDRGVAPTTYVVELQMESGVEVDYELNVVAHYKLNPFF